ncbi:hypothetical protein CCM_04373 [Cordyceps militaris CM01]|uniref:Uncharacterized protein n=1 Tax=Cordyceps militaris (strain CM01) TaxID=983644 RepID=G3JEI8_CORMM|nr:uncharacterized protein CCM_04373 [Cordyceps militaris CM01]EGX93001.1 hypothetical protein CCM_04373 [Cordyceps militaris CM01]
MPSPRPHSLARLVLGLVAIITLLVYFVPSSPALTSRIAEMTAPPSGDPIANLRVTLAQVPGADPPALRATITNNNPFAVSFLDYDAPVDALAVPLGLVELTPGAPPGAAPVATEGIVKLRRLWPPLVDFVHEVPGGGGTLVSEPLSLRPDNVPYGKLGDRFFVRIRGPWRAVMAMPKSEITGEFLEHIPARPNTYQGSYESDRIEIRVDATALELK